MEICYAVFELLNAGRLRERERETWNTFATFLANELLISQFLYYFISGLDWTGHDLLYQA
jgi:hypothetical protein